MKAINPRTGQADYEFDAVNADFVASEGAALA